MFDKEKDLSDMTDGGGYQRLEVGWALGREVGWWINRWSEGGIVGWMNRWINGCMHGHGWRDGGIYAYMAMDGLDGGMDRCMGVGMGGGIYGQMDDHGWMNA